MKEDQVFLAISKILNLEEYKIKEVLGHKLIDCQAASIYEARACFLQGNRHSELGRAAWLKWDQLALEEAQKKDEIEDLKRDFFNSPTGGKAEEWIIKKIKEILSKK